jgi:predicted RNA binding protein YcfA (HicA-like mRNA interferase family)
LHAPRDFTWEELSSLLRKLGYKEARTGKTAGSRRRFVHATAATISLHKPHPGNELKRYQVDQLIDTLKQEGLI